MAKSKNPSLSKNSPIDSVLPREVTNMGQGLSRKQLAWRCRRGTKELDLILGRFVQNSFDDLSDIEKAEFESLLNEEDTVLTEWLCYGVIPPSRNDDQGMVNIVSRILSAHNN